MSAVQRRVFATSRPPFRRTIGSALRTHRLATGLAEVFNMTVVALAHGPRSGEQHGDLVELRQLLPGADVLLVAGRTRRKRVDQLRGVVRARSSEWGRYATREFISEVARHAPGAVLHVDDLGAADALTTSARLAAFAPHNVE